MVVAQTIPLERRIDVGQRISIGNDVSGGLATVLTPESPDFQLIVGILNREALKPAEFGRFYGTYLFLEKLNESGKQIPFNFGYGHCYGPSGLPSNEGACGAGILMYSHWLQDKDPIGIVFAMHNHYGTLSAPILGGHVKGGCLWKVSEEEYQQIGDLLVPMPLRER